MRESSVPISNILYKVLGFNLKEGENTAYFTI